MGKTNYSRYHKYVAYSYTKPANAINVDHCKKISVNTKGSVDLRLYRMTQKELQNHIKAVCKSGQIPFEEYDGNIYSIRYPDKPCFVAHMDIIREESVKKPLFVDPKDQTLHRDGGTLGADDRAGVNLILNHIKDINFIFTRDEEVGCLGIKSLMDDPDFLKALDTVNVLIEPDRRNATDIIQYCEDDLIDELKKHLPDYRVASGLYTDVAQMDHIKPAVNLSCGYYEAHSNDEYLNIAEYEVLNDAMSSLAGITGEFEVTPYVPYTASKGYADDEAKWARWEENYWNEIYGDGWYNSGVNGNKADDTKLTEEELGDFDLDELKDEPITEVGKLDKRLKLEKFSKTCYCDFCQYPEDQVAEIEGLFICASCVSQIAKDFIR